MLAYAGSEAGKSMPGTVYAKVLSSVWDGEDDAKKEVADGLAQRGVELGAVNLKGSA